MGKEVANNGVPQRLYMSTMDFWFPRITENSSTLRARLSKTLDPKLRRSARLGGEALGCRDSSLAS